LHSFQCVVPPFVLLAEREYDTLVRQANFLHDLHANLGHLTRFGIVREVETCELSKIRDLVLIPPDPPGLKPISKQNTGARNRCELRWTFVTGECVAAHEVHASTEGDKLMWPFAFPWKSKGKCRWFAVSGQLRVCAKTVAWCGKAPEAGR